MHATPEQPHGPAAPLLNSPESPLDRWLLAVGVYVLPLLLIGFSALALLRWPALNEAAPEQALPLRVIADRGMAPSQAAEALASAIPAQHHATHLAETPFWLRVDLDQRTPTGVQRPAWLEFPSRHAMRMACWAQQGDSGRLIGEADRQRSTGALSPHRAGFVLQVPAATEAPGAHSLICRAEFLGPAQISVLARTAEDLRANAERFQRDAGWFDGGLSILALLLFITALINRNATYALFSVWMLLNLRMAALTAGWDLQWLGHTLPGDWLPRIRLLTMALCFLATYALFRRFFQDELSRLKHPLALQGIALLSLLLVPASQLLPYATFIRVMWVSSAIGVATLLVTLARVLWQQRSAVVLWYSAALLITLCSILTEAVAAALSLPGLTRVINGELAALSSSLLASLAVAAQMKQERDERRAVQRRLLSAYEAMPIGLFSANLQGRFTAANPALRQMLGEDLLQPGKSEWSRHFPVESWPRLLGLLRQQADVELELHPLHEPERSYQVRATLGRAGVEGLIRDVTERRMSEEKLRFQALHDPLTRVFNRRGIEQALQQMQSALPPQASLRMAYLDLDRFKLINDLYGHAAGDEVLQQVCARLGTLLSGGMRLGRVGGDEFVVLLPDLDAEQSLLLARSLLAAVRASPFAVGDHAFQVGGSMGLVELDATTAFKDAMASADRACREAKRGAGDGLVAYALDHGQLRELADEMRLVASLSQPAALGSDVGEVDGLYLEMQPIMSLTRPNEALNFEVLLRMRDAQGRRVPTPRLIAAGEHSGRMSMIDRWVLRQVLGWLKRNRLQLKDTQFVCVNLSGASLNDERFIDDAFDLLDAHQDVAPMLCLEITESVALHDLANTQRFIQQVRQYGARIALDDFGAGYTSFSYLKDLPGDFLKIDGSLIVKMNEHRADIAIVEAIVAVARTLGMQTIAEWAEDAATVETLAAIGVDYVQGFAIAAAQDPATLLRHPSSASFVSELRTRELVDRLEMIGGKLPPLFVAKQAAA